MVKMDRRIINIIAFSLLILITIFKSTGGFTLYVLLFPLLGSIYRIYGNYDNASIDNKRIIRVSYVILRLMFIWLIMSVLPFNDVFGWLIFIVIFIPIIYLEAMIVFDIPFGAESFVNWFLYLVNILLHMVAVTVIYYGLMTIATGIIAVVVMFAAVLS